MKSELIIKRIFEFLRLTYVYWCTRIVRAHNAAMLNDFALVDVTSRSLRLFIANICNVCAVSESYTVNILHSILRVVQIKLFKLYIWYDKINKIWIHAFIIYNMYNLLKYCMLKFQEVEEQLFDVRVPKVSDLLL